jgi:hypothetical protein
MPGTRNSGEKSSNSHLRIEHIYDEHVLTEN